MSFDTDPKQVAKGRADGFQVFYGDITDPGLLSAIHVERAALVVLTVDKSATALKSVSSLKAMCPQVPVIARARDLATSSSLLAAGAIEAYPEAIEASLRLGATALRILQVSEEDIDAMLQDVRNWGYKPVLGENQDK